MKTRRRRPEIVKIPAVTTVTIRRKKLVYLIIALLLTPPLSGNTQCEAKSDTFKSGKHVMYELYFNQKFTWKKAGLASLTASPTTYYSEPAYQVSLLVISSKKTDSFFKMRDTLMSVMTEKLEPHYFRKGAGEEKRYTVNEARFSLRDGMRYVNQKRACKDGSAIKTEQSDTRHIYDMLSILAQAHSFDPEGYTVGQRIQFPMATGRKVKEQTPTYRGIRKITAENGTTYRCLIFLLVECNKKRREKGAITFYITDDRNHLPVRLNMHLSFGSAKTFLRSVSGYRHPQISIITK